jgi:hypothetical protein
MTASSATYEINRSLGLWLLRLRLRDAIRWSLRGLSGGLAVGLGLALVARLRPLFTANELIPYCAALAGAGLILFFVGGWAWPRNKLHAARFFDQVYGLKERTSTALEIASGALEVPGDWAERQLADAAQAAEAVDAAEGLPLFGLARPDWLLALALLAALAAALALPNPQEGRLANERALNAAVEQTAQQIEAIRQEVQQNPALTQEQRDALTQPLEEAQRQLQEGNLSQEQAVAVLTQAENQLQQLADPQAQQQIQALQQAGQGMTDSSTTQSVGDSLANGDLQGAANQLANIDPSQLTPAQQADLANQLDQAASSLASTNPQLSSQMQQAADALRNGDTQAAQQALNQASQTLSQTASQLAQSQAAATAAAQVGQGQQTVARAGQAQQSDTGDPGLGQGAQQGQGQGQAQGQGQGQGQAQGQGQGQGQAQGQGQGQGQSQAQGQGQGGGGAGRGESDGQAQGGQAGQSGQNDNGAGDGGERNYEPIYAPSRLGGSGGPDVTLPGNGDPGNEVVGQGDVNPQDNGQVTVPYNQVYGQYDQAAHDAIRQGDVPVGLRPVVRDYFSSLQP